MSWLRTGARGERGEAAGLSGRGRDDVEPDVERAARGDTDAFARLYRRHVARIHTLARRLLGEAVAADATQEIFIRAWRYLRSYRGEAAFGTWLTRLALNLLLDRRRKQAASREDLATTLPETRGSPPLSVAAIDCEAALARLPPGARQVLVLHDVEGHSHAEIAEMLDITAGTSKSQLHRARSLLRDLLGASGQVVKKEGSS